MLKRFMVGIGCLLAFASPALAQGAPKAPKGQVGKLIIGTWRMTGVETRPMDGNGPVTHPRGIKPTGYITYRPDGIMFVQIMNSEETRPPEHGPAQLADDERVKAFNTYTAYFGHYTIDENDQSVTHHVEGNTNPRQVGNGMKRFVEVSKDRLSLNTIGTGPDGKQQITLRMWERVN